MQSRTIRGFDTNRATEGRIRDAQSKGEVVTGLLYIDEGSEDMHGQARTVAEPLTTVPFESLCPGNAELQKLQDRFR